MDLLHELRRKNFSIPSSLINAEFDMDNNIVYYLTHKRKEARLSEIRKALLEHRDWFSYGESAKLGKFLRRFITDDIQLISKIVNEIAADFNTKTFTFHTVKVNDAYSTKKFSCFVSPNSTLAKSCMNDDFRFLKHYAKIGAKALVARDQLGIVSRAVIWDSVSFSTSLIPPNTPLMDRVYSSNEITANILKNYAKEHGWVYKAMDNYSTPTQFVWEGKLVISSATIPDSSSVWGEIPYFDTFKFPNKEETLLSNTPTGHIKCYTRSKGGYYWYCPICASVSKPEERYPFHHEKGNIIGCYKCTRWSIITGKYYNRLSPLIPVISKYNPEESFIGADDSISDYPIRIDSTNTLWYLPHVE